MAMNIPRPEQLSLWRVASFVAFAVVVALFLLVSSKAGMRGAGVVMLVVSEIHLVTRRIPYGWEGREPSGYITGVPAVMVGMLTGAVGAAMLAYPELMLALFGWSNI
jgi:hypothetical protein